MNTLDYLAKKFNLDVTRKPPIEILNINRTVMAQTLAELGFKVGAEIGVAQGDHSKLLCDNIPGLKLYCVDVWEPYDGYGEYRDRITRYYEIAKQTLAPYDCVLVKGFSDQVAKGFEDHSLDFVYIDGAHDFLSVTKDICAWITKVRPGGIMFGHDFKRNKGRYLCHVQDVVGAYAYSHNIRPWFILGTMGHHDGQFREGTRSWAWIC